MRLFLPLRKYRYFAKGSWLKIVKRYIGFKNNPSLKIQMK